MGRRGELTDAIRVRSKEILGYEIDESELRLMPYVQYVMMNDQRIDPRKVNARERAVLSEWKKAGFIKGGASGLTITRDFWDAMNDILWIGYVDIE